MLGKLIPDSLTVFQDLAVAGTVSSLGPPPGPRHPTPCPYPRPLGSAKTASLESAGVRPPPFQAARRVSGCCAWV